MAQRYVMMESAQGRNTSVAVWAFSIVFGTPPDKSTTYIQEIYSDATKYFDRESLSRASE